MTADQARTADDAADLAMRTWGHQTGRDEAMIRATAKLAFVLGQHAGVLEAAEHQLKQAGVPNPRKCVDRILEALKP